MLQTITRFLDYFGYLFSATDLHGIHSPFVYSLAEFILYHKGDKRIESIEYQRTLMLKSNGKINGISLATFVDTYTLPAKYAFALNRLVSFLDIRKIHEYGQTTGIETNYVLNSPLLEKNVPIVYRYFSTEQNEVKIKTNEQWLQNYPNLTGKIDWNSNDLDNQNNLWDLHVVHLSQESDEIWNFWESNQKKLHNHSIVIFTNIRHSDDHYLKWKQISNESKVTVDIDLFRVGILFFRKEQPKESFLLRY